MWHDWFSAIDLPLTGRQFRKLPRNPAYKYEYSDGRAWLSPRPEKCHAVLDLPTFKRAIADAETDDKRVIRPLQDTDWPRLPALFAAAFHGVQPFASLTDGKRLEAAEDCLGETRGLAEGPLVGAVCLVAEGASNATLLGANLVTLPPRGTIEDAVGLPHLTWIFVEPNHVRHGVGTALLAAAVQGLGRLGYTALASTFLLGNESSMLWHWRAGFKLLEKAWSRR